MSPSGSWLRRLLSPLTPSAPSGRRATSGRARFPARSISHDIRLWEAELADTSYTTDPVHPPIEQVAVHLRRLRWVLDDLPADVSFIRWEGVLRAYDDFLGLACRELGIPTDLLTIGFGRFRDEERIRLERILGEAGLSVR